MAIGISLKIEIWKPQCWKRRLPAGRPKVLTCPRTWGRSSFRLRASGLGIPASCHPVELSARRHKMPACVVVAAARCASSAGGGSLSQLRPSYATSGSQRSACPGLAAAGRPCWRRQQLQRPCAAAAQTGVQAPAGGAALGASAGEDALAAAFQAGYEVSFCGDCCCLRRHETGPPTAPRKRDRSAVQHRQHTRHVPVCYALAVQPCTK